jgi:hypothetical protein
MYTAKTLYQQCKTSIPRNETALHRSQLLPSWADRGNTVIAHRNMNVEIGNGARAVSFLGIHKSDLLCSVVHLQKRENLLHFLTYKVFFIPIHPSKSLQIPQFPLADKHTKPFTENFGNLVFALFYTNRKGWQAFSSLSVFFSCFYAFYAEKMFGEQESCWN